MAREIDEAWIEEAVDRYQRLDALQGKFDKALHGVEVTVRSADGLVEVLVGADGAVRDVRIPGGLRGRSGEEVARSVREAITAAADAARWARQKLHAETFGEFNRLG
jgi:DNA-binding protein YbaB